MLEGTKPSLLVTGHSAELGWHSRRIPLPPEHPLGCCQGPASSGIGPGARYLKRRPALRGQRGQRERAPIRGLERGSLAQRRQLNRVAGLGERRDQGDPERAGHLWQLALRGDAAAGGRRNTSWLHGLDDKPDQSPLFDHRFEPLPEPFSPL